MVDRDGVGVPVSAEDAFADLYRREYPRAVALGRSLCGSWAVAEELTQEAFLVAHRRWAHVSRLDDPGQWVRRLVANRAVSSFRRAQAERRALRRLGPGRSTVDPPRDDDQLTARIAALPPRQAQAVAAIYVEQLDVREAAALLGCSASTLRTHLERARATLRHTYEKEEVTR